MNGRNCVTRRSAAAAAAGRHAASQYSACRAAARRVRQREAAAAAAASSTESKTTNDFLFFFFFFRFPTRTNYSKSSINSRVKSILSLLYFFSFFARSLFLAFFLITNYHDFVHSSSIYSCYCKSFVTLGHFLCT